MAPPPAAPAGIASQPSVAPAVLVQPGASASSPLAIQVVSVPPISPVDPHWTVYWSAFATPFVALIAAAIAATIAYRQWKTASEAVTTAKNKLKLDLFERRFNVFQAASRLIVKMSQDSVHEDKAVMTLLGETAGAEFLFNEKVNRYLVDQLYARAGGVMRRQLKLLAAQKAGDPQAFEKFADEQEADREWFEGQLDVWKDLTRPFLELTH